jgi:hypothetical protein
MVAWGKARRAWAERAASPTLTAATRIPGVDATSGA